MHAQSVRLSTSGSCIVQVMSRVKKCIACIVISLRRKTLIGAVCSTERSSVIITEKCKPSFARLCQTINLLSCVYYWIHLEQQKLGQAYRFQSYCQQKQLQRVCKKTICFTSRNVRRMLRYCFWFTSYRTSLFSAYFVLWGSQVGLCCFRLINEIGAYSKTIENQGKGCENDNANL